MKGLMKASYDGFAIWRRWRRIGSTKRFYGGEFSSFRSVGRPRKRWINTVKEGLKKRGLDVRHARRMIQDRE